MDTLRLETMSMRKDGVSKEHERAAKVAEQFESVFVRTLVSSLRQTAMIGDGGGMFGGGPGADTYGDWFDQNLAEQIGRTGHVGIAESLMADFKRAGALGKDAETHAREATAAADHTALTTLRASSRIAGGTDVVR